MFNDIYSLVDLLLELNYRAEELMWIRLTPVEMYPSMKISNEDMVRLRNEFNEQLAQILHDLKEIDPINFKAYDKFVELRDKHNRLIMSYRLYTVNRLASLFMEITLTTCWIMILPGLKATLKSTL